MILESRLDFSSFDAEELTTQCITLIDACIADSALPHKTDYISENCAECCRTATITKLPVEVERALQSFKDHGEVDTAAEFIPRLNRHRPWEL